MDKSSKIKLSEEFAYLMTLRTKQRTLKLTKSSVLLKDCHLEDIKRMLKMRHQFKSLEIERARRKKVFELYFCSDLHINSISQIIRENKATGGSEITVDNVYQIIFEEFCLLATKYIPGFKMPPLRRKYGIRTIEKTAKRPYRKVRRLAKKQEYNYAIFDNFREQEELLRRKKRREIDLDSEVRTVQENSKLLEEIKDGREISIACAKIKKSLDRMDCEANELKKEYARLLKEFKILEKNSS